MSNKNQLNKGYSPDELREQFWADDELNGSPIRSQYEEINAALESNTIEFAKDKLKGIKKHAIRNCDFYKDFNSEDDFPVINKLIILQNQESMMARGGFQYPLHKSSTSGSTGIPFTISQDYRKRMRTIADLQVFGERGEYPIRERQIRFCITSSYKRSPEQEERENIYYVDTTYMDDTHLAGMIDEINNKRPYTLSGYTSTIVNIANYIKRTGAEFFDPNLTSIRVGGEGCGISDYDLLEEVFQVPIFRRYSSNELGILGQDQAHCSAYELNWGSFYFELLDMNEDKAAYPGEPGRIVVTDLFNYAQPIIRYDTGDIGIMEYPDNALPRLKEVWGRRADCVYSTKGELVCYHKFTNSLRSIEGLCQWQFIQAGKIQYIIKVISNGKIDFNLLISKLKGILGENADIKIQCVENIPQIASGKRRLIICNYKK